jgi:hypothetical protein
MTRSPSKSRHSAPKPKQLTSGTVNLSQNELLRNPRALMPRKLKSYVTFGSSLHPAMRALCRVAAEFVRLKVNVIVTSGIPAVTALQRATSVIPIVSATAGDPVTLPT